MSPRAILAESGGLTQERRMRLGDVVVVTSELWNGFLGEVVSLPEDGWCVVRVMDGMNCYLFRDSELERIDSLAVPEVGTNV